MSTLIDLDQVVIDLDIYPRAEWSQPTVSRYAEAISAGEQLPPIAIEAGTSRLLDGMHRYRAHRELGLGEIDADEHEIPDGVPTKLFAASFSTRHGERISHRDLQEITREVVQANPEFNISTAAKYSGVTRQTASKWVSDITERRRSVRKVKALLLSRSGWSNRQTSEFLEVSLDTVNGDVKDDISVHLTEDVLRDALDDLPAECAGVAEQIREERMFADWTEHERQLLKRLRHGETIVVNMRDGAHDHLVTWASQAGLFVRVDRRSEWGNPFEIPADGDRATVIHNYAEHYLPNKPSLLKKVWDLHGYALGCWCAPEPCHGDILADIISGANEYVAIYEALDELNGEGGEG